MAGEKHDQNKTRYDLLPFNALGEIAKVMQYGCKKYGEGNWKLVKPGKERYLAAILRHYAAIQDGEKNDSESGLLHAAHLAASAIFVVCRPFDQIAPSISIAIFSAGLA